MKRLLFAASLGFLTALTTLSAGCSQNEKLNPVQGKVLLQGQLLAGALVSFHAENFADNTPTAFTKEDGTFSVMTGDIAGAKAGTYKVTVMCQVPTKAPPEGGMSFGGMGETEDRLKGAYANRNQSKISVTIKDGPNQLEPFDLK